MGIEARDYLNDIYNLRLEGTLLRISKNISEHRFISILFTECLEVVSFYVGPFRPNHCAFYRFSKSTVVFTEYHAEPGPKNSGAKSA